MNNCEAIYKLKLEDTILDVCDKYDFMIAVFSGAVAGIIDIFFVQNPQGSKLVNFSDSSTDKIIKKFAKTLGWNPKKENSDNVVSAIGWLEKNFKINYDHRHSSDVNGLFNMNTKNHHIKSLGHSPDIIGLFFSILDQFTSKASFISEGKFYQVDSLNKNFELRGNTFIEKIFFGFCNWISHIMSDIGGSSGGRGNSGRGSGIPIPFMNLFLLCDFGNFRNGKDIQTLAVTMTRVFQEGYDARFGLAISVPVLIQELMIRAIWVIKKRYFEKKEWSDCIPTEKHGDLRLMLLIGYTTFCLIDGFDAGIRSGGNTVTFILHLNLVAWIRLIILVIKELIIRFGPLFEKLMEKYLDMTLDMLNSPDEKKLINEFYERINKLDFQIINILKEFIETVEKEYQQKRERLEKIFNENNSKNQQLQLSIDYAKKSKVSKNKIIYSSEELDVFILGNKNITEKGDKNE